MSLLFSEAMLRVLQSRSASSEKPMRLEFGKRWCPESDLNQRPIAYEAIALPLSYRGFATCVGRDRDLTETFL